MSKEKVSSDFEKMFSTQEAFRRNKRYYDAIKITQQQHLEEQKRRKPDQTMKKTSSTKIEETFQSAKKDTKAKVDENISKFKFRLSFYNQANPENEFNDYQETSPRGSEPGSPKSIKGVPHDKLLSRQSLFNLRNKQCQDERQFNNFYIRTNDLSNTPSMDNYSPRNLNIALEHMTDLYYDSKQKYEQLYFDNKTTSCLFHLKKQKDKKGRYFFNPKRQEDNPATDIKPENIAKSFSVANPYKTNKILNFYKLNGRELPSHFDQRFLSVNKNFYKNQDGRLIKPEVSFVARKYKQQLLQRDASDLKQSKRPYFQRNELCDQLYFKQERKK